MRALAADHDRPTMPDALGSEPSARTLELDDPLGRYENEGGRRLAFVAVLAQPTPSPMAVQAETLG